MHAQVEQDILNRESYVVLNDENQSSRNFYVYDKS